MKRRALLRLGVRGLSAHRLRSGLSVLGVLFGVAAVVAMSAVGEGARRELLAQIESFGIDNVIVRPPIEPGVRDGPARLTLREAESLASVVPALEALAPVRELPLAAELGTQRFQAVALGTSPAFAEVGRLRLAQGRFLTPLDLRESKRVAVVGASVARRLAPAGALLGEAIRVGGDWFEVVGVLEPRASPRGRALPIPARDVNGCVLVPLPALVGGRGLASDALDEIVLRVAGGDAVAGAAAVTRAALVRLTRRDDFQVVVPREILRGRERARRVFAVVTGSVAALGLLVGGIGIMNIMLASVAERTAEIGIRRAIGASRRDVAAQFLVESALLTSVGGAVGLLLGSAGAFAIQRVAGWPMALAVGPLLLALLAAFAVGIGFGCYPAWRAAQLEPMEALRRG
ncbi:MAG: ABC transporter permease [Vicinamibacteria bacterium]